MRNAKFRPRLLLEAARCLIFSEKGWFGTYEEKAFPRPVRETAPEGPWVLDDGQAVENPFERVARASDGVLAFVRNEVCPKFFPSTILRSVKVFRGVYSPQIATSTILRQPRFGRIVRDLPLLVEIIRNTVPHSPLIPSDSFTIEDFTAFMNARLHAAPINAFESRVPESGGHESAATLAVDTDMLSLIAQLRRELDAASATLEDIRRTAEFTNTA